MVPVVGLRQDRDPALPQDQRDQEVVGERLVVRGQDGRTLAWDEQMDAKLDALTVDQVNAAFRRHVSLDQLSIVKAGDFQAAGVYRQ